MNAVYLQRFNERSCFIIVKSIVGCSSHDFLSQTSLPVSVRKSSNRDSRRFRGISKSSREGKDPVETRVHRILRYNHPQKWQINQTQISPEFPSSRGPFEPVRTTEYQNSEERDLLKKKKKQREIGSSLNVD